MSTNQQMKVPRGRTAVEAIVTGGALALALVLLNVLSCGSRARVDLTESKIYSLSDASRSLVSAMKEKVNIKGYFGNVPPEYSERVSYVDMLLAEYAENSNGKIVYEKIDPWGDTALQEEIRKDGVDKLRLQSLKDDTYEQVPVYFHVVFSHLDEKEVWTPGQGFSLEGLEYDFSTRIKRLGHGKKKVGITTGFGEPQEAQLLQAPGVDVIPGVRVGLGDLYEVQTVNWKENPKAILDVDVLIVNGPTEKVSDAAKFNLDQLVMQGKPVLFFVGGMRWSASGNQQMNIPGFENPDQPYVGMPIDNGLGDLLETYGFKVGKDVVLDVRNSARGWIPPGARQGMLARGVFPYAQSPESGEGGMLQGIDVIAMPFASSLELVGPLAGARSDADTRVIKLLETSPTSWTQAEVMAITRDLTLKAPEGQQKSHLVAAAVSGKFKSYYVDHPVPTGIDLAPPAAPPGELPPSEGEANGPAAPAPAGVLKESTSHTRMVVIASPVLVADQTLMDVRMHGDIVYVNGFLAAHNIVDWLAEEVDLIAVRSKKPTRPIERLEAGQRSAIKYANVVGAPLLLVVLGVAYWRVRERKRRNIVL